MTPDNNIHSGAGLHPISISRAESAEDIMADKMVKGALHGLAEGNGWDYTTRRIPGIDLEITPPGLLVKEYNFTLHQEELVHKIRDVMISKADRLLPGRHVMRSVMKIDKAHAGEDKYFLTFAIRAQDAKDLAKAFTTEIRRMRQVFDVIADTMIVPKADKQTYLFRHASLEELLGMVAGFERKVKAIYPEDTEHAKIEVNLINNAEVPTAHVTVDTAIALELKARTRPQKQR